MKRFPTIGAHLVTPRIGYSHHGIYVGRGSVIHYSGLADGLNAGPIEETSLELFSGGYGYSVKSFKDEKYRGKEAVQRARSRLGENDYDFHANNCEHFCRWVITGISSSQQIDRAVDFVVQNPTIKTALKVREAVKQKHGREDLIIDAATSVATAVASSLIPVVGQVELARKIYKWIKN